MERGKREMKGITCWVRGHDVAGDVGLGDFHHGRVNGEKGQRGNELQARRAAL